MTLHVLAHHLKRMLFMVRPPDVPDLKEGVTGGLAPRAPRPSASLLRITPTQALYMSVKSVSIFSTMHCTAASLSLALIACSHPQSSSRGAPSRLFSERRRCCTCEPGLPAF